MTTLRQGDRGPKVLELQCLLAFTGHDPGPLDGIFGPRTRRAMTSAQGFLDVREGVLGDANDDEIAALRSLPRRGVEVPRILTPVSAVDMRIALAAGYASTFGRDEPQQWSPGTLTGERAASAVRVALAQLCVEHGCEPWGGPQTRELPEAGLLPREHLQPKRGELSYIAVWNFGIGNRQVTREHRREGSILGPPLFPYCMLTAPEGEGDSTRDLTSACYAYANAAEGAAAYWRFLRDRCGPALAAFERGDPAQAAHELKVGAWSYSGSEEAYSRGMVDRFKSSVV